MRSRSRRSPSGVVRWTIATLAVMASMLSWTPAASAQATGVGHSVCDRTYQVADAIVTASGAATCAHVTLHHLREITALDLSYQGIASLKLGDFDGLVRVDTLDLSGNALSELPQGVLDGLLLLRSLHLDDNRLRSLPGSLLDELFMLEEVTTGANPLLFLADAGLAGGIRFAAATDDNVTLPAWGVDADTLDSFLNGVETVDQFIGKLPALYKERFSMVFESDSPARAHVSGQYPRIVSWGPDGRFIFSWNTDPAAPASFRNGVEFLRRGSTEWSAGSIDFSGATPVVTEPESCKTCHGPLNKPLWGAYSHWDGTDYDSESFGEATRQAAESSNSRIAALDFTASYVSDGARYLKSAATYCPECVSAAEEGAKIMAWRHAEVLLNRLRRDREDLRQFAENTVCTADPFEIGKAARQPFNSTDHNLTVLANTQEVIQGGRIRDFHVAPDYYYGNFGTLGEALALLLVVDLWEDEPIVRWVYRKLSNTETIHANLGAGRRWWLRYASGEATAEDELIARLRLHFGRGTRASIAERETWSARTGYDGTVSAYFVYGHLAGMAPHVCNALRNTKPRSLTVEIVDGDDAVLSWDAPTDTESLTGYRILRGVDGEARTPHVTDTGNTSTTWTDTGLPTGEYVWTVQGLFDGYPSPESNAVRESVSANPLEVAEPTTFVVVEGDTAVTTLSVTDAGVSASDLTWSAAGGADSGQFTLSASGVLALAAPKDYEAPDDADADNTYEVTVQVTDDTDNATADVSVLVANRNEAPTANAGADQSGVEAGATVTLSGTGDDPDADDVLQYAWTQAGGPTVALSAPAEAATTFTAPTELSEDTQLSFTLKVTDTGGLFGEDAVAVTVLAAEEPETSPLTATFQGMPSSHDGTNAFSFQVQFSEEIGNSYVTLRDNAFTVTNSDVTGARRVDGRNDLWEITVGPESTDAVTITLPGGRACGTTGALCTGGNNPRPLSNSPSATVEGPQDEPLTATFQGMPSSHDGTNAFSFEVQFSEEIGISYVTLRDSAFTVANGDVTDARRVDGRNDRWQITVDPESTDAVTITLPGGRACGTTGAVCTQGENPRPLSNSPSATVAGP